MTAHPAKKTQPRYVLIIEDNALHAELLTEVLDRHLAPVIINTVDTIEDGIEFATRSNYDLILTDGVIQDTPITEFITHLTRIANGTPIIVITGRGDERLAAELIKRGASEYLVKTKETIENLPALLLKHLQKRPSAKRREKKRGTAGTGVPSPEEIVREVDRLTHEALAIAGPRRRKRGALPHDFEQIDRLIGQIQKLRQLAAKLTSKD